MFILDSVCLELETVHVIYYQVSSFYIRSSDGIHEAIHPFSDVSCRDLITNYDRKSNDGDSSAARKAGARQGR